MPPLWLVSSAIFWAVAVGNYYGGYLFWKAFTSWQKRTNQLELISYFCAMNRNANQNPGEQWIIWGSLIFLMLVWGSTFILVKRGLETFRPAQVASLRITAAAIPMFFWGLRHARLVPAVKLPYLFVSAMLSMFVPAFLFANAQTQMNSSMAGVLNALTPAMTFIIGVAFFAQPASWMKVLGLFIGFVGSATLILVNADGKLSLNAYGFFVVGATICYGANVNIVKHYLHDIKPIHLTTITLMMAGIPAAIYLFSTNWLELGLASEMSKRSLLAVVTLGLMGTALAQTVFNRMLSHTSALFASSITYFIPIVAVMWGVWDGEVMSVFHYAGMALVIGGIVILNRFG